MVFHNSNEFSQILRKAPLGKLSSMSDDSNLALWFMLAENDVKAPDLIERAKEEIEAIMHTKKSPPHHHEETHGMSDDIDENTPIDEVKGPSVFQRAKEELEALAQTIHPKKEPSDLVSSPKEGGFRFSIRKGLEKVRSPWASKKN